MGVDAEESGVLMLRGHGCLCCVVIVGVMRIDLVESWVLMLGSHGC